MDNQTRQTAVVNAIFPDRVTVTIFDLDSFRTKESPLRVGSYLRIVDYEDTVLIAMIESFTIVLEGPDEAGLAHQTFKLDGRPIGTIREGVFERGTDAISISPKTVEPAHQDEIRKIFEESIPEAEQFLFSHLASDLSIRVPVNGNRFFNKHIAVVGSTGSGKSYTVSKVLQSAIDTGNQRNNTHVVIFDIHSEYRAAFPDANYFDINNLELPYWLMNGTELQEFFLDTEGNDHNQRNVFKQGIILSKKSNFDGSEERREKLTIDSPVYFDIECGIFIFFHFLAKGCNDSVLGRQRNISDVLSQYGIGNKIAAVLYKAHAAFYVSGKSFRMKLYAILVIVTCHFGNPVDLDNVRKHLKFHLRCSVISQFKIIRT